MIPRNKPNITFQGQGYAVTAIVWNDTANSSHGTFYSGSVQVFATNFVAKNISFMVIKFCCISFQNFYVHFDDLHSWQLTSLLSCTFW